MTRYGAVDVHYPPGGGARAGLVVAVDPRFTEVVGEYTAWLDSVAAYQPGHFYLRELPAVTAVLDTTAALDLVVIDGYVDLDPRGRPGLGTHLHTRTGMPVVGVAKTVFRTATHAIEVHRGGGTRPVYVTAAGLPRDEAAALVAQMAGAHRVPDALRRADTLARH